MNCREFKSWLIDRDIYDKRLAADAMQHLDACESCRDIFDIDRALDHQIRESVPRAELPSGLHRRVRQAVRARDGSGASMAGRVWRHVVPALSVAALLLFGWLHLLSGQVRTVDRLGDLVLSEHLNAGLSMTVQTENESELGGWLSVNVGKEMTLPDFKRLGLAPLGGRECRFGRTRAAYLLCEKNGQKASLFLLVPDTHGISLASDAPHRLIENGHQVTIWREDQIVYALVI